MHPQTLPDPPVECPAYIWRNGAQHWSMSELARRRGCSRQAASKWADRHPEHTVIRGKHKYAKDIQT
jgi:hypothetical protein